MSHATARLANLERIRAVQEQKHRLEEWRLADLRRREREVVDAEVALIASMNEDSPFHGLFVDQAARRLDLLGAKKRSLETAVTRQGEAVREQARREKAAEKLTLDARRLAEEERRRLADLDALEALLAGATGQDAVSN